MIDMLTQCLSFFLSLSFHTTRNWKILRCITLRIKRTKKQVIGLMSICELFLDRLDRIVLIRKGEVRCYARCSLRVHMPGASDATTYNLFCIGQPWPELSSSGRNQTTQYQWLASALGRCVERRFDFRAAAVVARKRYVCLMHCISHS